VVPVGLSDIRQGVAEAAAAAGRAADEIALIAVSKVQPAERVAAVLSQGHRLFGENRVQEAQDRWPPFQAEWPGISLHLIGPLQTNKARSAVEMFDAIHTVDRLRLATVLARLAQERGASPDLFVQVNTGREAQKAGCEPDAVDDLIAECRGMDLPVVGLMCIPPEAEDPAPHFAALAGMARRNGLAGLSMGMSGDYRTAIAQGATHVRVGSAIFGERTAPDPA
jgi:PLP dependent protein